MKSTIDLKQIEKKAFRSNYEDGLWDIYYGLIVIALTVFMRGMDEERGWLGLLIFMGVLAALYGLFRLAKKIITIPRMGLVTFGEYRKKRTRTMRVILAVFIGLQTLVVVLSAAAWLMPSFSTWLTAIIGGSHELMLVAGIGSMMVCIGMSIIAHFSDFDRGYWIAVLMGAAVFTLIFLQSALYAVIIGCFLVLPGVVLLIRFMVRHPLVREGDHE